MENTEKIVDAGKLHPAAPPRDPITYACLMPYRLNPFTGELEHWNYHGGGWMEQLPPDEGDRKYVDLAEAAAAGHPIVSYVDTWAEPEALVLGTTSASEYLPREEREDDGC